MRVRLAGAWIPSFPESIVMNAPRYGPGIEVTGRITEQFAEILTPDALAFAARLQRAFGARRTELLARRVARQVQFDAGELPGFLDETREVREDDWTCDPVPAEIQDRRVEITGPVDRKMIINALNCGANVFMADFEDANTPTWSNNVEGQFNLRDAAQAHKMSETEHVRGKIVLQVV
jgi:malate synthase